MGRLLIGSLISSGMEEEALAAFAGLPPIIKTDSPRQKGIRRRLAAAAANICVRRGELAEACAALEGGAFPFAPGDGEVKWLEAAHAASSRSRGAANIPERLYRLARGLRPRTEGQVSLAYHLASEAVKASLRRRRPLAAARVVKSLPPSPGSKYLEGRRMDMAAALFSELMKAKSAEGALAAYQCIPARGPSPAAPAVKAAAGGALAEMLTAMGELGKAGQVLQTLGALERSEETDAVRARPFAALIQAHVGKSELTRAWELLRSVPDFCDLRLLGQPIAQAAAALYAGLKKSGELALVRELEKFAARESVRLR
jgi:hypothetical protein